MKKYLLFISALFLLASCSYPDDYQNIPPRKLIIQGKEYNVTNVALCDGSYSCNVWVVYPSNGTGGVISVQQEVRNGKHNDNNSTIIIE